MKTEDKCIPGGGAGGEKIHLRPNKGDRIQRGGGYRTEEERLAARRPWVGAVFKMGK